MAKPKSEMTFRPIEGEWKEQANQFPGTLAEYYNELGIVVDENLEFARINQYSLHRSIWVRVNALKIVVTIWEL